MKILIGIALGVAAAWAALAIWRRIPPFPDFEPEGDPPLGDWQDRAWAEYDRIPPYDEKRHGRFSP